MIVRFHLTRIIKFFELLTLKYISYFKSIKKLTPTRALLDSSTDFLTTRRTVIFCRYFDTLCVRLSPVPRPRHFDVGPIVHLDIGTLIIDRKPKSKHAFQRAVCSGLLTANAYPSYIERIRI